MAHIDFNLLEKTEVRITQISLTEANLDDIAKTVARVLQLEEDEVYVIDAIGNVLALDILTETITADQIAGKQQQIFAHLNELPGVSLNADSRLESDGILGWIGLSPDQQDEIVNQTSKMSNEVLSTIAKRALIISTGDEVVNGQIEDTNKPFLLETLGKAGFKAKAGPTLNDDIDAITAALLEGGEQLGYGLLITTGGVGAESKDCTIEALQRLAPNAETPYILSFKQGHGRHAKPGVRIAVGQVGTALVVCLPGPNEEVRLGVDQLLTCLAQEETPSIAQIAEAIAQVLKDRFARLRG